jgi:hypothetical protein
VDSSFVLLRIKNRDIICRDIISEVIDCALGSIFLFVLADLDQSWLERLSDGLHCTVLYCTVPCCPGVFL